MTWRSMILAASFLVAGAGLAGAAVPYPAVLPSAASLGTLAAANYSQAEILAYNAGGSSGGGTFVAVNAASAPDGCNIFASSSPGWVWQRLRTQVNNQPLSNCDTLADADAAARAAGIPALLDANVTLTGPAVLKATWIGAGGIITRGSYSLQGNFWAPATLQMFDAAGSGPITLTSKVERVATWFGIVADCRTDNSNAMNLAQNSFSPPGKPGVGSGAVYYPGNGNCYAFNSTLTMPSNTGLRGDGQELTILRYNGSGTGIVAAAGASGPIYIDKTTLDSAQSGAIILDTSNVLSGAFSDVRFRRFSGSTNTCVSAFVTSMNQTSFFNAFTRPIFENCGTGVYLNTAISASPSQYPTRYKFLAPECITTVTVCFDIEYASGTKFVAADASDIGGTMFKLGPNADRTLITTPLMEAAGATMYVIDPAATRTVILGTTVVAGAIGIQDNGTVTGNNTTLLGYGDQYGISLGGVDIEPVTGVPTGGCKPASLRLRTDGTVGSDVYVCTKNGTWTAASNF